MSYITRLSLICVSGITWQWIEVDSFKFKGKKIVRMLNMWFQKIENCKSACACGVGGWGGRVECCASKTKIFKRKVQTKSEGLFGVEGQTEITSMGEVWIFSATTHYPVNYKSMNSYKKHVCNVLKICSFHRSEDMMAIISCYGKEIILEVLKAN